MSSSSIERDSFLRIRDIMNTEEKIRRISSEEPLLQLDISKDNRKQIDIRLLLYQNYIHASYL